MAKSVELDDQTHLAVEFAAKMAGTTAGGIIARLVTEAGMQPPTAPAAPAASAAVTVTVYADYAGHRTHGIYDPVTTRIEISAGPLGGRSFKSPSGAAGALIKYYKPQVSNHRDGLRLWRLEDGRRLGEVYPSNKTRSGR